MTDRWEIPCRDIHGTRAQITIWATRGGMVLGAPRGEAAVLTPEEGENLVQAVRDAVARSRDGS
ncbi:hypothetical protein BAY59_10695 [Prauserella coralliicola]|nr:hypothetical protein BAY59_10695 [Prauserella coralliicola]